MAELQVPPYFICPITLEIMKDPVIVSTGITYDRQSIEKWMLFQKNAACPVTKSPLSAAEEPTPNVVLRSMIQSWCASHGVARLPAPVTRTHLMNLLKTAAKTPGKVIDCLQRLRTIAVSGNESDKKSMESAGVCRFLESLIGAEGGGESAAARRVCEEAVAILGSLQLSESSLKSLVNGGFLESIARIMKWGTDESRGHAVILLKHILQVNGSDPGPLTALSPEFFTELIQILRDQISDETSAATLKVLAAVCPAGGNRIKAVDGGCVELLIDLLPHSFDDKAGEMLVVLDILCQCADGRAKLLEHDGGLAVVGQKMVGVSALATDRAVRIVHSVSRFSAAPAVVAEMLRVGMVEKLCLVFQVDCGPKTKQRAREALLAWRKHSIDRRGFIA